MGVKYIKKLLAPIILIGILLLLISGVYAENIDVKSSVMTESPISADVDVSLSSYDALNDDLSNNLEHSVSAYSLQADDSVEISQIGEDCEIVDSNIYSNYDDSLICGVDCGYCSSPMILSVIDTASGDYESDCLHIADCNNVPVSTLNDFKDDTSISKVKIDLDSEGCKFIRDVTSQDDLLKFENDYAVMPIMVSDTQKGHRSESVFDGNLKSYGYISDSEVYSDLISDEEVNILNSVGSEGTTVGNSNLSGYDINHVQTGDEILDGCTVTEAFVNNFEDEFGHLINDNSHGLDYAYVKHENVIDKDMLNLIPISYMDNSLKEQSSVESWNGLNDILGIEISGETLLPDHKAIWTPLLLLIQQDSKESIFSSHADDNANKDKINTTNKTDDNSTLNSNSTNKSYKGKQHNKHWRYNQGSSYANQYVAEKTMPEINVKALNNVTSNSTANQTNSSNATANVEHKKIATPKSSVKSSQPTFTLIYAIIGIVVVSILFNSTYMKRDE